MKTPSKHKNIHKLLTRRRKVFIKCGGSQGWVFKEALFPEDISSIMLRREQVMDDFDGQVKTEAFENGVMRHWFHSKSEPLHIRNPRSQAFSSFSSF